MPGTNRRVPIWPRRGKLWEVQPTGPDPVVPAGPPSTVARLGWLPIAAGAAPYVPPDPPVNSNVADVNAYWVDVLGPTGGGVPTGTIEDMDVADLQYFKNQGMDAVVVVSPYTSLYGLGDDQRFPSNPIGADLSAPQYHDARILRDVVMPKLNTVGIKCILVTQLKNRNVGPGGQIFTGIFPPGGGTWNNDTSPSTVAKLQEWASFARAIGCIGLMFDAENYPDNVNGNSGEIWGGQEWVSNWHSRGYEVGLGLGQVWPDLPLAAYHNFIPATIEEAITRPGNYETDYASWNFYYGVTLGLADAAPNGNWSMVFHQASTYYRGPAYVGYRQQDINGPAAFFSRKLPHWYRVHDHVGVEPFIWVNKGVYLSNGQPYGSQEVPYSPSQLLADRAQLRNWHMVTKGDIRVLQHYVYNAQLQMPFQDLDTSPVTDWPSGYGDTLAYLSAPTLVSSNAPSLSITTPANGFSTSALSISVVVGTASDDFGITGVTWVNSTNGAAGHLAMNFVKDSGSYTTSFTWHMALSIAEQAAVIPIARGSNTITFTARNSKGVTTSVVRTVTGT